MTDTPGGWLYRTFHWDETTNAREWRDQLTADGWEESEYGVGAWAVIDGRRVFGVTLRRWTERPHATPPK